MTLLAFIGVMWGGLFLPILAVVWLDRTADKADLEDDNDR